MTCLRRLWREGAVMNNEKVEPEEAHESLESSNFQGAAERL